MEMQEMIERLLAEIRADRKADQEKADANRQADREVLKGIIDVNAKSIVRAFQEKMVACVANIKNAQKETTACHDEMEASIKKMEPNPGEKETAVERQEFSNEVAVHSRRTCRSETAASQENTEKTEQEPGTMQSMEEHQEIPKEKVVMKPVKGRKKRHRGRKPAAGRHGEPKELTRGDCGFGRKSAATCRKVSCRAKVAWRKRNLVRRIETQINYGPRKRLTVTGRKTTSRATVAWHSENVIRKDCARDQAKRGTPKRRKDSEGMWKFPECNNGLRNRGLRQQLRSKTRIKDPRTRQQLHLGNERTTSMIYRKAIRLEIVKRALRISSVFRKTRKWILWRGRPPLKWKMKSCTE
jgi:hypothetical protein